MHDNMKPAVGITWAVALSAVLWIILGAAFWAVCVEWGWRQ